MCLLCVIQKWSRRIAAMLPWLVIPLLGLWALSQLLPPAFRFEITSPRLACVFVLLFTLFWYEILMPELSAWRVGRNARLRERKRSEAIEMHKLRKTATRRCRNCLTPYREQNPGGGRFMCSYCGHISKRPVLDLPVPSGLGLPNTGILKDLVGKGGKILNGKVWSDNGWMCGDWLDNGIWVAGSFSGKPDYFWRNGGGGIYGGSENCLAEKSYSRVFVFICRVLTAFFLIIMWLWRKIFRVSNGDDEPLDPEHRGMLGKRGENGEQNFQESRGEKARRKAEEKRQARLEKEQLEEEERKQREEVARLVEERRRLRDEKTEADRDHSKGLPSIRDNDYRKETEKKRQERKKEKDKGSSKSNSDVEELEKRVGNEGERGRKAESDRRENLRTGVESIKSPNTETGHNMKTTISSNYSRGSAGKRYLDRMRGTFLSSSKAFTGASFFGKGASTSVVSRDIKSISSVDHVHNSASRKELSPPERLPGKLNSSGDDKSINHPVVSELQPYTTPRKSWQQLFNRSATVPPSAMSTVISRPIGKSQSEAQSPPFSFHSVATQQYDNPINFGLPSPFPLSAFPYDSTGNSTGIQLSSESVFPPIRAAASEFLPEESDIFEDPCYIPDPASLLGPVSESLDNFQLDLGFVTDNGLEKTQSVRNIPSSSEVIRPSPIESPMSRLRVTEERQTSSLLSQCTSKAQDVYNFSKDDLRNANEKGTWQMWNTSPLGQDGLGLAGGTASWLSSPELTRSNKEDNVYPLPQKTMASLFKKDDQVPCGTYSQHNVLVGSCQKGGALGNSMSGTIDDPWLPETLFGQASGCEKHFLQHPIEEAIQNESYNRSPNAFAANQSFELSPSNLWANKKWTLPAMGESIGNSSITRPPVGGGLYNLDQSLWSTMTEEK